MLRYLPIFSQLFKRLLPLALLCCGIVVESSAQVGDLIHFPVEIANRATTGSGKNQAQLFGYAPTNAYNGVVLAGTSTGAFLEGFIRFEENDGFGAWQPLTYLETSTGALFLAGYRSDSYRQNALFELRFDTPNNDVITIKQIGVFDNRLDDDYAAGPYEAPQSTMPSTSAIIPPKLIPRGEWDAEPFNGRPVPLAQPNYTRMTFHHAACCGAFTYEEGLTQVKGIQRFHQVVRGWSDIGYHFIFDQSGRLYQGRPFMDNRLDLNSPPILAHGAHVGGANTGNIGVSLLGCYHPPEGSHCEDVMSPALRDSLVTLYSYLSERYGVTTNQLFGHRDQTATACPGNHNYPLLPELRLEIDELIETGNAPIAHASLSAQKGEDEVVQLSWTFSQIFDVTSYRIDRETQESAITVFESTDTHDNMVVDPSLGTAEPVHYSLYAVSSTGIEQRLSSAPIQLDLQEGFTLGENFPNPFTTSTTIRYYMNHEGIVTLKVYNSNGRLVDTLVNGYQEGDRWHHATFNAGNNANGIYYYRLQIEGFSSIVFDKSGTMVLLN